MALAFARPCLCSYILTNKTRGHKLAAAAWNGVARSTVDSCVNFVTFSRQTRRAQGLPDPEEERTISLRNVGHYRRYSSSDTASHSIRWGPVWFSTEILIFRKQIQQPPSTLHFENGDGKFLHSIRLRHIAGSTYL